MHSPNFDFIIASPLGIAHRWCNATCTHVTQKRQFYHRGSTAHWKTNYFHVQWVISILHIHFKSALKITHLVQFKSSNVRWWDFYHNDAAKNSIRKGYARRKNSSSIAGLKMRSIRWSPEPTECLKHFTTLRPHLFLTAADNPLIMQTSHLHSNTDAKR